MDIEETKRFVNALKVALHIPGQDLSLIVEDLAKFRPGALPDTATCQEVALLVIHGHLNQRVQK